LPRAECFLGETRRTYGVVGDKTNLAARLMSVAPPGQIRCDYEVYNSAKTRWTFQTLPSVRVKGKAGLVRVYQPIREAVKAWEESQNTLFGRHQELDRLDAALRVVNQGGSRIVVIEGEAGIGKSRLVVELIRLARERGISGLVGAGQSIEQQTAYRVWRDLLSAYFGLREVTDIADRRARIISLVNDIAPDQIQRLPLINDILHVGMPDTELTAALDPAHRQQSLVILLINLLRTWTGERPLMLILEDVHWLDSLSWELTVQIARAMVAAGDPLLLVLTMRSLEDHSLGAQLLASLRELDATETLNLNSLSSGEILGLVTARLGLLPHGLPRAVAEFVSQRCGGNPFFAEELIFTLRDQGLLIIDPVPEAPAEDHYNHCVVGEDFTQASAIIPDTLHGLLLSRIDRLPPDHKLTSKVAAVIGRTFAYSTLQYVLNSYATMVDQALQEQLNSLIQRDFAVLETREPDLSYIFKHIITQETAYQTLLFSQRRQLHRMAAKWYEKVFGGTSNGRQTSTLSENLKPTTRCLFITTITLKTLSVSVIMPGGQEKRLLLSLQTQRRCAI
jgi:predicted ATPase